MKAYWKRHILKTVCFFIIICMVIPAGALPENEPVTRIVLNGTEADIDGGGAKLKKDNLTISEGGCYILSGSFTGRVKIDAPGQKVVITLAGADITCTGKCPLLIKEASSAILILQDGTENRLQAESGSAKDDSAADESQEVDTEDSAANALKCGCPLQIEGSGSLELISEKNGISASKSLTVNNGTLTITCENDGIHLSKEENKDGEEGNEENVTANENEDGIFTVTGGNIGTSCGGDGIQAEAIIISGGKIDAVCGGGSANASTRSSGWGDMRRSPFYEDTETEGENHHGLKAESRIDISGGEIRADAMTDALNCGGSITVNGGTLSLSAGDDGIHADETLWITGGTVNIVNSYEGLEAHRIEISGGDLTIKSSDDGMNANGGSDAFDFGFAGNGRGGNFGGRGGFNPGRDRNGNEPRGRREDASATPGSMTPPDGMQQPGGMTPPDGMQQPEGMTPPDGMQQPEGMTPPDGMQQPEGMTPPGMPDTMTPGNALPSENTQQDSDMPLLHITGGNISVDASGDGLDSNGDLIIEGGNILVAGPTDGGNGALDSGMENGGVLQITGGTVLAFGAAGMAESFDSSSAQPSVTYTASSSFPAGTAVILTDENGNEIFSGLISKPAASVILSAPGLTAGRTYTLQIGSITETFTVSGTVTYIGTGNWQQGFGHGFGW